MSYGSLKIALSCWLLAVGIATAAHAQPPKGRQHLVNPGDDWSQLSEQLNPGDEIILMPGVHRPAILDDLRGKPGLPIVIRSLDVEHMATINAAVGVAGNTGGRHGLLMRRVTHVVIRDVNITNATVHGIEATGETFEGREVTSRSPALVIQNVRVERIGPVGRRNAIMLRDLDHVLVEQSSFAGWGGSAIELVACSDVIVKGCTFTGLSDFSQVNAVQIRAGSERVAITSCEFVDAGVTGAALGGTSEPDDFRKTPGGAQFEAQRVRVENNLFRGGHSAVAFIHCDQCVVRNNTIVRPQRWVYLLLDRSEENRSPTSRSIFAVNLIQWEPGDVNQLSHQGDKNSPSGLTLEQNLWWAPDLASRRARLGEPAGISPNPQLMTVDPKLDERFFPTEPRAVMFGRNRS